MPCLRREDRGNRVVTLQWQRMNCLQSPSKRPSILSSLHRSHFKKRTTGISTFSCLLRHCLFKDSCRCVSMVCMKGNTSCEKHRKTPISKVLPAALQTPGQSMGEEFAVGLQHSPRQQQPQKGSKASVRGRPCPPTHQKLLLS